MSQFFQLKEWLPTVPLFHNLSEEQLRSVVKIAEIQSFGKGEILFNAGNEATGFFVIKSGRVKIYKISSGGKEQILNIFETGQNFAEVAALDGKAFPAAGATLEPTELIFFPRLAFLELLHQYPDIGINMLISLSKHLRHLTNVIETLSFKDVPQRLAAYLLGLRERCDDPHSPSTVVLNLTKSQLAAALGTIPATLSRAFNRLNNEGIITIEGPRIQILDADRLEQMGGLADQGVKSLSSPNHPPKNQH